ncbi:hypothetical protein PTTG_30613, partial [Puccinia triticina 1-1 BBBD Race 1]
SINHQGFYDAVAKIPNHANLAIWLIAHKWNADRIIKREGFMTALQYEIQVRTNALTHRVTMPDGSLSVANISIYWKEIVLTQHAKVVWFGEDEFKDNPYAVGGCRFGWDPITSQPTVKKEDHASKIPLHLQQPVAKGAAHSARPGPKTPKGPSGSKGQQPKQGSFKGGRWGTSHDDRDDGDAYGGGGGNQRGAGNGGGGGNGGNGSGKGYNKGKTY